MIKSFKLISLFLLAHLSILAQVDLPRETITVFRNSDFLLTGETLFFTVNCRSTEPGKPGMSKVAYVELINGESKSVLQAKISLMNGEGSGDFFLPSKLNSDHYTLLAYTQWMRNFDYSNFFKTEITIINPFRIQTQSNFITGNTSPKVTTQVDASGQSSGVNLNTGKETYGTREKVVALIGTSEELVGGLTFNVRLKENAGADTGTALSSTQPPGTSLNKKLPELRGKIISGTLTGADTKPLANKTVFLSVPGKDYFFYAARSDANGKFHFIIEFMPLSRNLTLQCEKTDGPVTITIDNDFLDQYDSFKPSTFRFDTSYNRVIEKRSVYSQVENSYYSLKKDSTMTLYPGRFYDKPDKSYLLDAYTRFPTMEDILREYIVEVIVRKRGESYELKVMDGKTRLPFSGDPLILLDGILVKNIQTVMDYDPKLLKKVEIVTRKYFLGPATFSGIISLETFDGDARRLSLPAETRFEYEGTQPVKSYFSPVYNQGEKLKRIPDYRVQLVWVPNVKVVNKSTAVEFYTSDVAGTFEVTVQGVSRTTGPFKVTRLIQVVP